MRDNSFVIVVLILALLYIISPIDPLIQGADSFSRGLLNATSAFPIAPYYQVVFGKGKGGNLG